MATDSIGSHFIFAAGRNKHALMMQLVKQDFDFLYDQKKGFGDGRIIAILKGAPELDASNLEFI